LIDFYTKKVVLYCGRFRRCTAYDRG